jgi:hypothetical protein
LRLAAEAWSSRALQRLVHRPWLGPRASESSTSLLCSVLNREPQLVPRGNQTAGNLRWELFLLTVQGELVSS